MPQKGLLMSKVREVLRLTWENQLKAREVSRVLNLSHSTVLLYLSKARKKELIWDQVQCMDDASLQRALLEEESSPTVSATFKPLPDFPMITLELRKKHVNMQTLWEEYQAAHSEESYYSYSQFCALYHDFIQKNEPVMLQVYKGGEVLFTDFAGDRVPFVDRSTGEILHAEIFVACMGASNYTFAKAVPSQQQIHWIPCHIETLEFMGGAPLKIVPDNLRSAVSKPDRYEAQLNRSFADFAQFYGTCILPARSRKPRDKGKVEKGVQVVETWLLGKLRKRTFFSIAEINQVLRKDLLPALNDQLMKKIGKSRKTLFETVDQPALRPIPSARYEMAEWREQKLANTYHVTLEHCLYSAPYRLIGEKLTLRYTSDIVEIFHGSDRVASHKRVYEAGQMTTDPLHRPPAHQYHHESKQKAFLEFIQRWSTGIGPATEALVTGMMAKYSAPELATRSLQGIRSLERKYSPERLEKACSLAVRHQGFSYFSVKSILEKKIDVLQAQREKKLSSDEQRSLGSSANSPLAMATHTNIRGKKYYATSWISSLEEKHRDNEGEPC